MLAKAPRPRAQALDVALGRYSAELRARAQDLERQAQRARARVQQAQADQGHGIDVGYAGAIMRGQAQHAQDLEADARIAELAADLADAGLVVATHDPRRLRVLATMLRSRLMPAAVETGRTIEMGLNLAR